MKLKKSFFLISYVLFFQGLNLINESNKWEFFNFKLKDVLQAWSAGCILQGEYLNFISQKLKDNQNLNLDLLFNLIEEKMFQKYKCYKIIQC